MPAIKRSRVGSRRSVIRYVRGRRSTRGSVSQPSTRPLSRANSFRGPMSTRLSHLESMIETKHGQWTSANNIGIAHNNVTVITKDDGGVLNPFQSSQGAGDPMGANNMQRIGDKITIKGMMVRGFFEGALNRSKVYFRVMLIRGAKGETFNRLNLFKSMSDNKMLDQINTERFSVVWQKIFNVTPPNATAQSVDAAGQTADARIGITGNRIIKAWIPGRKFGRKGVIQYEDATTTQVKFYDYRFVVLAYDWYGTPQDVNTVGRVNEMYSCLYYKDA